MRTCTDCGVTKPLTEFTPIRGTPWTHTRCKPCRAARGRSGRRPRISKAQAPPGMRICASCGIVKPLDDFTPTNGSTYRKKTCKPCRAVAAKAAYRPQPKPPRTKHEPPSERTCTECGVTKPIADFTPIRSTRNGFYGRCRTCRNARARARYHSTPDIRAAEIARALRNKRARRLRRRILSQS